MCVLMTVYNIVVHSTALNSSDNLPPYPPVSFSIFSSLVSIFCFGFSFVDQAGYQSTIECLHFVLHCILCCSKDDVHMSQESSQRRRCITLLDETLDIGPVMP